MKFELQATAPYTKARVPGDVHMALIEGKVIPEPLYNMNVKKSLKVQEKEWWYRKEFEAPYGFAKNRTEIVFEGLDTTAKIYLNGRLAGKANNCLVPHTLDVTGLLNPGKNTLIVKLDSGIFAVKNKEIEKYGATGINTGLRIWTRKPQYTFGWDWAPEMLTCGIWRPVSVVSYEKAAIRECFIKTGLGKNEAVVSAEVVLESFVAEALKLELALYIEGKPEKVKVIARKGLNKYTITRKLKNPKLWWPRGMGEAHLYSFMLDVSEGRELLDTYNTRFGIREVKLLQEKLPLPEGGKSFTLEINGQKVFCKGANWVPLDSSFARITKEKYKELVEIAAGANFNMFRVWGGNRHSELKP